MVRVLFQRIVWCGALGLLVQVGSCSVGGWRWRNSGPRRLLAIQEGRSAYEELERRALQEIGFDGSTQSAPVEEEPHPLRTQDWKLEMRDRHWQRREQQVTFHRNGTVWTSDGDKGDWWFDVGGLYWDVNTTVRATPVVLHHKAELHWNVFGEQPRMFRGTVTRDRLPQSFLPPWLFRPVVSSFVGSGVGSDTADTSYRHRQNVESGENSAMPPRLQPQTDRY